MNLAGTLEQLMTHPNAAPDLAIENYGVVGDLHTVALVGINGSIDFMCFPTFSSPTIFAALLDREKGGCFEISPQMGGVRYRQMYLPETNVLISRFLSPEGVVEVVDCMPIESGETTHEIVRRVQVVRGRGRVRVRCAPRFDYARADHVVSRHEGDVIFRSKGPDGTALRLSSSAELTIRGRDACADLDLGASESVDFVLEECRQDGAGMGHSSDEVSQALHDTTEFWRRWSSKSSYRGRWRESVMRSALVLKLLTSSRSGALVAAPTFGLPEQVGGERNWDYRYTWLRDSAFALRALGRLGFHDEARAFIAWMSEHCLKKPSETEAPLQVLYGLNGERKLPEVTLDHLSGYRGTRPVRIGNAAYNQVQHDIYGEVLDALYVFNRDGTPLSYDLWLQAKSTVDWVCRHWKEPDYGIWEMRGPPRLLLHSKVMCWVAIDRALRLAAQRSFPAPISEWRAVRDEIFGWVHREFWDEDKGAYVMVPGSSVIDAASLMMPFVKFIAPSDPRWHRHLRALEHELVEDALVYRYRQRKIEDGLGGVDGSFTMCSFWYVENLARVGRVDDARLLFEKLASYGNHLGLYSEELGTAGEHLGNFPQGITHLGLISAALALDDALQRKGRTRAP